MKSNPESGGGFRQDVCFPFLVHSQNSDGGWGYRAGQASAVESTAWCLLALEKLEKEDGAREAVARGRKWLEGTQLGDGAWPTRPETLEGNWVTPLGGTALLATGGSAEALAKAARWICESRSGETGWRMRLLGLLPGRKRVEQDTGLEGWSWTPGTASWVEPTALAVIFLESLPEELAPADAAERRKTGEALLYDRMCPGGGWNSGNPKVYGVGGIPLVGPTAWALIALQRQRDREENRQSLAWLAERFDAIDGASSLALAAIALDAAGRPAPGLERKLIERHAAGIFPGNVTAVAQAAFALGRGPDALRWAADKG